LLPPTFLRQLISMYGDSMQSMVPQYLEASMDAFRLNQTKFNDAMKTAFTGGPFAEMAKRNMAMFEAAATAFVPGSTGEKANEISALKAQIADLQAKVDKLAS
jgi:polyhydroxyalkanoate synthesis regulator protein